MPFAVLAILFVLGSAWSYLHSAVPRRGPTAQVLSPDARGRLVAERLTLYCEARIAEAGDDLAGDLHLCPSLLEVTSTRYRVDLGYSGPRRDYQVSLNGSFPSVGDHDWSDERGSALRDAAFRFTKVKGQRRLTISGHEPSEARRVEFLHRFVAASEACLAEGARLDGLGEAELLAQRPTG